MSERGGDNHILPGWQIEGGSNHGKKPRKFNQDCTICPLLPLGTTGHCPDRAAGKPPQFPGNCGSSNHPRARRIPAPSAISPLMLKRAPASPGRGGAYNLWEARGRAGEIAVERFAVARRPQPVRLRRLPALRRRSRHRRRGSQARRTHPGGRFAPVRKVHGEGLDKRVPAWSRPLPFAYESTVLAPLDLEQAGFRVREHPDPQGGDPPRWTGRATRPGGPVSPIRSGSAPAGPSRLRGGRSPSLRPGRVGQGSVPLRVVGGTQGSGSPTVPVEGCRTGLNGAACRWWTVLEARHGRQAQDNAVYRDSWRSRLSCCSWPLWLSGRHMRSRPTCLSSTNCPQLV